MDKRRDGQAMVEYALILVLIAWLYNNAVRKTPYPHYW